MSQIPMTPAERIAALRRFGYNATEAEFLCLAALHGGYFLRRQFGQFLGRQDGGTVTHLVQKALAREHARASTWRQNTQLYHLCARPFYEALGQGDNRNRRPREWMAIKNKIMGLDFVLAHRDVQYLATDQEKLEYFTGQAHVDPAALPTKLYHVPGGGVTDTVRHFVDKYPLFLDPAPREGVSPRAAFCFVDEGMVGLSRFETYLAQYRCLFESLPVFQLVYVAGNDVHVNGASQMFDRFLARGSSDSSNVGHREIERLLDYFKARRLYETRQLTSFDRAQLIRLRDAREEFVGDENEALYTAWQTGGDNAIRHIGAPERAVTAPIHGTFSTHLLEHDYGLFGAFPPR